MLKTTFIGILILTTLSITRTNAQSNNTYIADVTELTVIKRILENDQDTISKKKPDGSSECNSTYLDYETKKLYDLYKTGLTSDVSTQPAGSGQQMNGIMPGSNQPHHGPYDASMDFYCFLGPNGVPDDFTSEVKLYIALIYGKSYAQVVKIYGSDDFPSNFIYLNAILNGNKNNGIAGAELTSGSVIPNTGFNTSTILYGVTDFFISRAKEEMVNAYIQKLYDTLSKKIIITSFLPNSLHVLKSFMDDNSLSMAKYGDLFKSAFEKDFQGIPTVLENETTDETLISKLNNHIDNTVKQEVASAISGMAYIGDGIYKKEQLPDILDLLASKYTVSGPSTIFERVVLFSDVASNTLVTISNDGSTGRKFSFTDPKSILKLSELQKRYWLNLIEVRNHTILNAIDNNLISKIDAKANTFIEYLQEVSNLYLSLSQAMHVAASGSSGIPTLNSDDIANIIDNSVSYINTSTICLKSLGITLNDGTIKKIDSCFSDVSEIHEGILTKQYGKVLDGTVSLLRIFLPSKSKDSLVIDDFTKYGSFLVNILMAKNDSDISGALDELIPHDSYKIKYSTTMSATISGYPGVAFGLEKLLTPSGSMAKDLGFTFGASLPIGVDLNWKTTNDSASWGFFLQIVDLGAIMNYRLTNNDSTSGSKSNVVATPQISLMQVLSPGLSLLVRPGRSPITLGFGAEFTPQLRQIEMNNATINASSLRYQITMAIDVTAITLFSKNK